MLNTLLGLPGDALELLKEGGLISWNALREAKDWCVNINRLRIVSFTKERFPACYADLDGGDKRMMRAFLEPEWVSNTVSLLSGRYSFSSAAEYRMFVSPHKLALFLQDTLGTQAVDDHAFVEYQPHAYEGPERWFFINGIATSRDLARVNTSALQKMFGRDFILVHNPTHGLVRDLAESALQKFTNINTEPVVLAFLEIASALLDSKVKKVAVLAHSQGTLVMGDVLDLIYGSFGPEYLDRTNMNDEDLELFRKVSFGTLKASQIRQAMSALKQAGKGVIEKLELYMFANAASRMCYLDLAKRAPHIESYANEHDIVAHLGVLARDEFHREDLLRIDGSLFTCPRYGHLLNAHYLQSFVEGQYKLCDGDAPRCIGRSVHDPVLGNPCRKHPLHVSGPTKPRLLDYYHEAQKGPPRAPAKSPIQPAN